MIDKTKDHRKRKQNVFLTGILVQATEISMQFQKQVILAMDYEHKDKLRHAEEFLCDWADKLKKKDRNAIFYIYGKKRPCMTCSARMKCSGIQHYNKHHGRLFMHAVKYQKTKEETKETIKLILKGPSYVTVGKNNKEVPGYDTDSGDEDDNFIILENNKKKIKP